MSIEESNEQWHPEKSTFGDVVYLSVRTGHQVEPLQRLPEWMVDRIIADHNRASSLDATLTRAQTAEAALAEAKAALRLIAEWDGPPGTVETVTNRGVQTRDIARTALDRIDQHPTQEAVADGSEFVSCSKCKTDMSSLGFCKYEGCPAIHFIQASGSLTKPEAVDVNAIRRVIAAVMHAAKYHSIGGNRLDWDGLKACTNPVCLNNHAILADPAIRPYLEQAGETT